MDKKIVDLIQEKDYITLKSVLEEKLALKIKQKIDVKKNEFLEKCKAKKKEASLTEGSMDFATKLFDKMNDIGLTNIGGLIKLGQNYKVLVDITGSDVEVQVLKGKNATTAKSVAIETTPITKGLDHAVAFVKEIISTVVLPEVRAEAKGE
jgi:hypothetical protein